MGTGLRFAASIALALGAACGTHLADDPPGTSSQADASADGSSPGDAASTNDGAADAGSEGGARPCGRVAGGPPLVFVTSETFTGAASAMVGQSGAASLDAQCVSLATRAGFSGSFKAWLFTPSASPESRIGSSPMGWARPDGTVVFDGSNPSAASPLAPINVTEKCTTLDDGERAWTGVSTKEVDQSCGDWNDENNEGHFGDPGAVDGDWQAKGRDGCEKKNHLYCFQTGE